MNCYRVNYTFLLSKKKEVETWEPSNEEMLLRIAMGRELQIQASRRSRHSDYICIYIYIYIYIYVCVCVCVCLKINTKAYESGMDLSGMIIVQHLVKMRHVSIPVRTNDNAQKLFIRS